MNRNQLNELIEIVESNEHLVQVFDVLDHVGLQNYYIGAGAVAQSVWNCLSGYPINHGISDIDLVYFDDEKLEADHEKELKERIETHLTDFPLWIDVKNQARVHLWYKEKFGYDIEPYRSLEHAISTWPTRATSLGLRREKAGEWLICAPFGIEDIFSMTIRPNTRQITKEIYMKKVNKWMSKWPRLVYEPWTGTIEPIRFDREIPFNYNLRLKGEEES